MPVCPACATDIPETAEICPHCSSPTPWSTDMTRLAATDSTDDTGPTEHRATEHTDRTDPARTRLAGVATRRRSVTTSSGAPFTFDTSKWFFADSLLVLLIPITMACYGFYASRGGEPLLGRRLSISPTIR